MECPFCDVPLVEVVSISESDMNLIGSLPYVIAYPLKRALVEKHPLTRINLLRDTFLNYLKYLGLITASEFFNSPIKDKNMVALFNRTLTETSFGLWNEFIREMLKFLNSKKHDFFCPDLNDYYIAVQTGGNRKLYKGEVYVQDAYGEATITKQNLTGIDSLINFRNRYLGHQQTLDDATYLNLWEQYFPIFRDLLVQMTFCADYTMYKTEHGETYRLQSDEIKLTETTSQLNANVWIEDRKGNRLDILPFFIVPGELSIRKEDKEQILIYESYTGKSIKFFSPEGTEKLTSGKILERLNLLLRDKQQEQPYTPERFTKEVFIKRIADENKLILDTLVAEKKVIPGVYVNRKDMEIKLKEWVGARASIFFIAAEAGSGKTNLLAEMQKQYTERELNSLLIRAGRMEKQSLTEQVAYLLNIDESAGLSAYPSIAGTQDAPTFILIDGLNEAFHAENLWREVLEITQLFEPGSIKFVIAARANSKVDLDRYPVSDYQMNLIYGENKEHAKELASLTHWLTDLNMEEMKHAWETYAVKDKSRFKPLFSFDDIAGFDRAIYDQINNPLVLRIFLEVYNRKNLPKKGNTHLNIWRDWFATFSAEERTFLDLLAAEVWAKGENELLLDDLLKNEELKHYLVSDNINAPYQRLKNLGWISRYIKDLNVYIGFTVEGALFNLLGEKLSRQTPSIDLSVVQSYVKLDNKLHQSGIEFFLRQKALKGDISLLSELIDEGEQYQYICILPLLVFLKAFGARALIEKMLKNATDNDWKAIYQLDKTLDNLELQIIRKELLGELMPFNGFNSEKSILIGLKGLLLLDKDITLKYKQRIDGYIESTDNKYELLFELGTYEAKYANYNAALTLFQKGIEILSKNIDINKLEIAKINFMIAKVWNALGNHNTAFEYLQKCICIQIDELGNEHHAVATSLNDIGVTLRNMGNLDEALDYYEKSLDIRIRNLGSLHPHVAISYNNLGAVWGEKGDYKKALEYFQLCLNIDIATLGEIHHSVATTYNNMGVAWRYLKNFEIAFYYLQKSIDIRIKVLGSDHPDLAQSYTNMGVLFYLSGDYEKSLEIYNKGLDIQLKLFDKAHPSVAILFNNVGDSYLAQKKYPQALEAFVTSYEGLRKGGIAFKIAQCHEEVGNQNDALNYFVDSAEIRKIDPDLGAHHESTIQSVKNALRIARALDIDSKLPEWFKDALS